MENSNRDEIINIVTHIESMLIDSGLQWSIFYVPSNKSYSIYISNEEEDIADD